MPRKTNNRLMKEHLIICEGRDGQEFLIRYLNSQALSYDPRFSDDIQVNDFGGNSELYKYLEILKNTSGYERLRSLMIIRDAENDAETAVREIQSALRKADLAVPSEPHLWTGDVLKIGFVLFPTCGDIVEDGTLEDLCLAILAEPQAGEILKEIDSFLMMLGEAHQRDFPRIFKNRLHTYFSVHNDYVSFKIGEAAAAGAFDWRSERLDLLKRFMEKMF